MSQIFELPDVGEGLTEADILSWKVAEGDSVEVNDVIVEIETAKSVVELPSPYSGTVESLLVAEGETVETGTPIIAISGGDESGDDHKQRTRVPSEAAEDEAEPDDEPAPQALVGSGPKADSVKRRARKRPAPAPRPAPQEPERAPQPAQPGEKKGLLKGSLPNWQELQGRATKLVEEGREAIRRMPANGRNEVAGEPTGSIPHRPTLAKPPVRKAAQDLGVDLADVKPTGDNGQVTKQDLMNYVAHIAETTAHSEDGDFWNAESIGDDRIERIKVKGVRKATARAMSQSAFTAPHVSIFVDVDATRTMEFVKRLKKSPKYEGVKVTPLLILAKAVIYAAARNPQVNATWTDSEILIKHYMNLGIAAATPRGLLVPNIKNAQDLTLRELAVALNDLTATAREGKTQPSDMSGGTFTITNIGVLGIDTGTPILNPGEVGILAFGTIKQKPWVVDGEVIPRWVTTLGGSFDHRAVDGDLSARFMADVAAILEEPALLLDM
ncbi:dihydrolipoamide acetyltransferase family protein [Microbacterium foliorum]|uniref:dihydrolipoamide acetyltransferase family protein n=1 Tax=Rothia terrae TaxID=396015 RepID=UPI0014469A8E|nr:dihydrolipoamide acetyltransferase family protein [Rothia terrae]MDT0189464.1 dihydrolipoamide acetyltransferase family protein [Rothia terrae]NKZ34192.1 2-oxo acid dehydrogenase subunit E2 [Rothia terrae]